MLKPIGLTSRETADQEGIDNLKILQIMIRASQRCQIVDEPQILKFLMKRPMQCLLTNYTVTGRVGDEHRDGLNE